MTDGIGHRDPAGGPKNAVHGRGIHLDDLEGFGFDRERRRK
jgi:hypothetical protein